VLLMQKDLANGRFSHDAMGRALGS
jgi:hypothetical protein